MISKHYTHHEESKLLNDWREKSIAVSLKDTIDKRKGWREDKNEKSKSLIATVHRL